MSRKHGWAADWTASPRPFGKMLGRAAAERSTNVPKVTVCGSPDQTSLNWIVSPGWTFRAEGK